MLPYFRSGEKSSQITKQIKLILIVCKYLEKNQKVLLNKYQSGDCRIPY